jgi:hypothetical protein
LSTLLACNFLIRLQFLEFSCYLRPAKSQDSGIVYTFTRDAMIHKREVIGEG